MELTEIPKMIKKFVGEIRNIHFPVQGHTSVVAGFTTNKGEFILKRTTHPLYSAWMKQEFEILNQLA